MQGAVKRRQLKIIKLCVCQTSSSSVFFCSYDPGSSTCSMQGSRQPRQAGYGHVQPHLPITRLELYALRGLALAWVDAAVLPAALLAFLVPVAPSLCLTAAPVPPAGLEEAGRVALCCFLTSASRGRTWLVRATGIVLGRSEPIRVKRGRKSSIQRQEMWKRDTEGRGQGTDGHVDKHRREDWQRRAGLMTETRDLTALEQLLSSCSNLLKFIH